MTANPPNPTPAAPAGRSQSRSSTIAVWTGAAALACCLGLAVGGGMQAATSRTVPSETYVPILMGLAVGTLVALLQRHPRRALGLIPYGALASFVALLGLALEGGPEWCLALLGGAAGLLILPLRLPIRLAKDFSFLAPLGVGAAAATLGKLAVDYLAWPALPWLFVAGASAGTLLAFWLLYAEFLEQTAEVLLWPIYRIGGHGPGKRTISLRGPVLVVSNHTAWLDPLWLGKVIPRRIIPMMTSLFYDLPVMRWLMVHVVGAIRVQESKFRREVPELEEAIQALDRGECVVIFPEGRVRRKEEEPMRQFGQGVWHILRQRPETPVVVCWIEGGWGSYFSYLNGPPMRNKPFDWWRAIRIGINEPQVLDPEVLAEHRATRAWLMRASAEARRFLGLEPVVLQQGEAKEEDEGSSV